MTRTEEEALVLWSELQEGHPTMSGIELIEHHLEMAKQTVREEGERSNNQGGIMEKVGIDTQEIVVVNNVATLEITDSLGRVFHSTLRELTPEELGVVEADLTKERDEATKECERLVKANQHWHVRVTQLKDALAASEQARVRQQADIGRLTKGL